MFSLKKVLPFAAIAALVALVYVATHQKTHVEPAKKAVATLSTPSVPAPDVRRRDAGRGKASRDFLPAGMRRDLDLQEQGYLAAKVGIDKILEILSELTTDRDRESFLSGAFRRAADLEVFEALDWARRLPVGTPRDAALLTLFREWSGSTGTTAFRHVSNSDGGIAVLLGRHLFETCSVGPEEVITFAGDFIKPFEPRAALIATAAGKLAATDRAKALAIGEQYSGRENWLFETNFVQSWARYDARGALQWAEEATDSVLCAKLQRNIVKTLAYMDVGSTALLLQSIPPGKERARVLHDLASRWAHKDTRSALQWAESLPDEDDRSSALTKILSRVPVGIGVQLVDDTITGVMPDSPASRAGLVEGERIIAFSAADGQWVDTNGLDSMGMVNGIRGAANTSVSLRVGAKDGGTPRNVTLTREQIMMLEK